MINVKVLQHNNGKPVNIAKQSVVDVNNISTIRTDYEIVGIVINGYTSGPSMVSVTRQERKNSYTWNASFYNASNQSVDFTIGIVAIETDS